MSEILSFDSNKSDVSGASELISTVQGFIAVVEIALDHLLDDRSENSVKDWCIDLGRVKVDVLCIRFDFCLLFKRDGAGLELLYQRYSCGKWL
jgi:hypothetical protein